MAFTVSILVTSVFLFSLSGSYAQTSFDWPSVEASANLSWVDCYDAPFECARLQVPLDYANEDGAKAGIALIKYPSTATADNYRGTVLFNPGGPGESGVITAQVAGPFFAQVIGSQYDIVSFDPRGVGVSEPRIEFFLTATERALWLADPAKYSPIVNATHDATLIPKQWAYAQLLGRMAKDRDVHDILEHVGTDDVARDMLRITEAVGQANLMYYGISYGTTIGATFATMFPDRIERMIIDGVMDVEAYYLLCTSTGNSLPAIKDTDAALQTFFDGCAAAGPSRCAFYADTASQVQANLESLYASVLASPVPVNGSSVYGIVDFPTLKNAVFNALYDPYNMFTELAQGLAELQAGNGTRIYTMQLSAAPYQCNLTESYLNTWEAQFAVSCGDAKEFTASAAGLTAYWDESKDMSSFVDAVMNQAIVCSGWKVHREGRFMGPISGNTSFPLLAIGNTADPKTPLYGAKKAAAAFPGAVVLTQDSPGHTSLAASSNCVYGYVQAYFQNGTLPEVGTVCSVESVLFPGSA